MTKGDAPTIPAPASTVILTRDSHGEIEVYLLKRSKKSAFMPGLYVFPGGTVEREDMRVGFWKSRMDLEPADVAERFGADLGEEERVGHLVAAVRETFEEAGILLAWEREGNALDPDLLLPDGSREAEGASWFLEAARDRRLRLAVSLLRPWAHWITPLINPRRFDTRFFHCHLPPGQDCVPDAVETEGGMWLRPIEALEGNASGRTPLSPPTLVTLFELHQCGGSEGLDRELKKRTRGPARCPRAHLADSGLFVLLPWDPHYGDDTCTPGREVKPGEPFSRLLHRDGLWRPARP